ncbi:hypothetical protein J7T55_009296 [Diaporthe amygdali]|uniref:uncharacterized protein n=1 Tax=Phomopsis amygdali TaxID=1214568 RepID=UPI0022FE9687|nr:uncharacterized protein J7T55_009296 [Diaporthe amygdali]KAJ0118513.1 hypothetical protein J7T55_009296 [Diaporthe amygdali]
MDPNTIDALLERYLTLLDEYTTLRVKLGQLHTSMFQHLARANFSAERGMRYGPDFYDERMQALRQVSISTEGSLPVFSVSHSVRGRGDDAPHDPPSDPPAEAAEAPGEAAPASGDKAEGEADPKKQNARDPLRWFGVLTPLSLRQTQACAVEAVEQVIPRLVSLNAEMQDVEIQVRRARKKRAKERAAAARQQEQPQQQQAVAGDELAAK